MLIKNIRLLRITLVGGGCLLLLLAFLNLTLGSVPIPNQAIFKVLFGFEIENETWRTIILNFRAPKLFTAVLVGSGLALSGLLMQTMFRNPLAGPFVLGISSGASLMVALSIMLGSFIPIVFNPTNPLVLSFFAIIGSVGVLLIVLTVSVRVKDSNALLIIGIMLGSISSAIISVLQFFSSAEEIKFFLFWNFGSLAGLSWLQLGILAFIVVVAFAYSFVLSKPLNAWLLGEDYAKSMGVGVKSLKIKMILVAGILAGTITAFAGPIAFVGIAVPHLTRMLIGTVNHKILIPATILMGAMFLLISDTVAQVPSADFVLPINAITSALGAPIVIWIIVSKGQLRGGVFK